VVFFSLGAIGAATALQALYEQVFDLDHLFSGIVITDNRKSGRSGLSSPSWPS